MGSCLRYAVCPPPETVGGAVGESRTVKWSPAGLHFGGALDLDGGDQQSERVYKVVEQNYRGLEKALASSL